MPLCRIYFHPDPFELHIYIREASSFNKYTIEFVHAPLSHSYLTRKPPFFWALFRSWSIHPSILHGDFGSASLLKFWRIWSIYIFFNSSAISINIDSNGRLSKTSTAVALANWNKSAYVTPEYLSLIGWRSFTALTRPEMPDCEDNVCQPN